MLLSVLSHAKYTHAVCSLSTMQDRLAQSAHSLIPVDSLVPVYVYSWADTIQQTSVVMTLQFRLCYSIIMSFDF